MYQVSCKSLGGIKARGSEQRAACSLTPQRARRVVCSAAAAPARSTATHATSSSSSSTATTTSDRAASRRAFILSGAAALVPIAAATVAAAAAAPGAANAADRPVTNKEVDAADSPLIQELLRRTEEKREERRKERLREYNRKNFRDAFVFDAGSPEVARARGLSPETAAAIQKWLEENDDQAYPGLRKRE